MVEAAAEKFKTEPSDDQGLLGDAEGRASLRRADLLRYRHSSAYHYTAYIQY
jgi:hypothetical protein